MTVAVWTLTWSAAGAPILAAILLYCVLSEKRAAADHRHFALLLGLSSLFLLPVLDVLLPQWFTVPIPLPASAVAPFAEDRALFTDASRTPELVRSTVLLTAVWLTGTGVLVLRLVVGLMGVRRLRRRVLKQGTLIGVRHCRAPVSGRPIAIQVFLTPLVRSPAALGIHEPIVLLPPYVAEMPAVEREAVIRHETAHVQRGDLALLPIVHVIRALHWLNPLAWIAAAWLRQTSEEACDTLALRGGITRVDYAQMLVGMARRARVASAGGAVLSMARNGISKRVEVLLRGPTLTSTRQRHAYTAALILALVGLAAATRFTAHRATGDPSASFAAAYGISTEMAGRLLDAAVAEDVVPEIAFGLISVESGFDSELESTGGAIGLTQLLPSTATTLDARATPASLRDPEVNARLGLRLLKSLIKSFPGELERALLAYNIGPAGAARWDGVEVAAYPRAVLAAAARGPSFLTTP